MVYGKMYNFRKLYTTNFRKLYTTCIDPDWVSGPSCSKPTMSLVNDLLKFSSSDMQIR